MFSRQIVRNFTRSAVRRASPFEDDGYGGYPGRNLPFSISNRYSLTLKFMLYLGSGFALPFLIVRHQLTKK